MLTQCCSKQAIIETEDERLCRNCGMVHGEIEVNYSQFDPHIFDNTFHRYRFRGKLPARLNTLNNWTLAKKRKVFPHVVKTLDDILITLNLPSVKSRNIKNEAIQMYIRLLHAPGYSNRDTMLFMGAIVYYLLKKYGIKHGYRNYCNLINQLIKISKPIKHFNTQKTIFRVLGQIQKVFESNTNMDLESTHTVINKEIFRIGQNLNISNNKLIQIIDSVLDVPEHVFSGKSQTTIAAAFLAMEFVPENSHSYTADITIRKLAEAANTTPASVSNIRYQIKKATFKL